MKNSEFNAVRRHVLHGLGATIALPFFESLIPRGLRTAAAAAASAPRLVTFYVPNGYNMATYVPVDTGSNYTLSPCLQPLSAYRSQMLVMSGLFNQDVNTITTGRGGDHAIGTASFGTYNRMADGAGSPTTNAKSADQYAADVIATSNNRNKSLEVGVKTSWAPGDNGFPAITMSTTSWATPTSPNTTLDHPSDVFTAIFGDQTQASTGANTGPTPADVARAAARKSVLDTALSQATSLKAKLGVLDATKLDQYLTQVRAVENQVANLTASTTCTNPGAASLPQNFNPGATDMDAYFKIMINLSALALQCDATRVLNFMTGYGQTQTGFGFIGIQGDDSHHGLSHNTDQDSLDKLTQIVTYEMKLLTSLCDQLNGMQLAGGKSLLDNTIIVSSSEMGDPAAHDHQNMPTIIVGGSNVGMSYNGGNCIKYDKSTTTYMASMWLSVLDKFGAAPSGGLGNMAGNPITARLSI